MKAMNDPRRKDLRKNDHLIFMALNMFIKKSGCETLRFRNYSGLSG